MQVPVLFWGNGIQPRTVGRPVRTVDIGPTLSALLGIEFPPAREGRVLSEVIAHAR